LPVGSSKPRALRAVTRCATLDEFIAGYARFATDDGLFVVTRAPRAAGPPARPFMVQLADGTTVLRGVAEIVEAHPLPTGPEATCGMRLAFTELDAASRQVHRALLDESARQIDRTVPPETAVIGSRTSTIQGPAPQPPVMGPPARTSSVTLPSAPVLAAMRASSPTALPPPPVVDTETMIGTAAPRVPARRASHTTDVELPHAPLATPPPARVEQRTPGSPYVLPANPLWELPPEALEHFVECTMYEHTDVGSFDGLLGGEPRPALLYPPPAPAPWPPPMAAPWPPPPARLRGYVVVAILAATLGLGIGYALHDDRPAATSP
jgi:hypothetical protein